MRRKIRNQIQCQHLYASSIHGDEINHVGGKRGFCGECGAWLDSLPLGFRATSPNRTLIHPWEQAGGAHDA